jgi:predicted ATP-grasp superfamily ATP-dependent carboligase
MRVLIYEHFTAQGIGREPSSPDHSFFREGRAMCDAVAADFRRVEGLQVHIFPDGPDLNDRSSFSAAVNGADRTLIIAPESDHVLSSWCGEVRQGRLLGPSDEAIMLTSDKLRLAEHWREHGVPTPATTDREPTACDLYPLVWKPRDGAGSVATFRLDSAADVARARATRSAEGHTGAMILQEFVAGRAASVAFLCGPAGNVPLAPCVQSLSDDGRFKYRGGELPIPDELARRAVALAQRALDCVPGLLGYVGVDLVLGETSEGDRAIEINPRLTTSYVGLRALADFNMAEAMFAAAEGSPLPSIRWKPGRVRFAPDGTVFRL